MHSPLQLFCAITHRLLLLHHLINDLAIPTRRKASAREMVRAPPSAAAAVWEDKRPTFEEEEEKNELIELSVIYRAVTSLNGSIPRPSRLAGWLSCLLACLLTGHHPNKPHSAAILFQSAIGWRCKSERNISAGNRETGQKLFSLDRQEDRGKTEIPRVLLAAHSIREKENQFTPNARRAIRIRFITFPH